MANTAKTTNDTQRRPALTPEARENQLISLAIDLAEKQLSEGTASAQVITHYLRLGSTRERIEREILEKQKDLVAAKTKSYQSSEEMKELLSQAIKAFGVYKGEDEPDDYD